MRRKAVAITLLLVLGACTRKKEDRTEQLAALENAYQSGVLSKAEYDAKKQALTPAPPQAPVPVAQVAPPSAPDPVPAPVVEAPAPKQKAPAAIKKVSPAPRAPEVPVVAHKEPPPPPPAAHNPKPPPPAPAASPTKTEEHESKPQSAACEDPENDKVKGAKQRFYTVSAEAAKKAAREALEELDFSLNKDAGDHMEASKRRHIGVVVGAGGEKLILRFEKSQQGGRGGTLVTAETKKSFVGRLAQKSWTNAILAQIGCQLKAR